LRESLFGRRHSASSIFTRKRVKNDDYKLHPTNGEFSYREGITFDHVANNYTHVGNEYTTDMIHVECFSAAAKLRNSLFLDNNKIPGKFPDLISHTKGAIALVSEEGVLYLRSSLM
jgi:hypothetical protein